MASSRSATYGCHFGFAEDPFNMQETCLGEEVAHLVGIGIERERPSKFERERRHGSQNPIVPASYTARYVEQVTKYGLPLHECVDAADPDVRTPGHHQSEC